MPSTPAPTSNIEPSPPSPAPGATPVPAVGDRAAEFTLPDQFGSPTRLRELLRERAVLVVFYPFAFSGICTTELDSVRDDPARFCSPRVHTVAISCDPMFALKAWAQERHYEFPLLSDFWPHGQAAAGYQVFDDNAGMARRGTFLIDTDGIIRWSLVHGPGQARDLTGFEIALD